MSISPSLVNVESVGDDPYFSAPATDFSTIPAEGLIYALEHQHFEEVKAPFRAEILRRLQSTENAPDVSVRKIQAAWRDVFAFKCYCGKGKRAGHPFCTACHIALPEEIQKRLYRMIKRPFVLAYEDAQKILKEKRQALVPTGAAK